MSRHPAPKIKRQRFTVVFAQTVFHSVTVTTDDEDAAIEKASERYENDERLFPAHRQPRPWRRWWGCYEIADSFPTPVKHPSKGEAS